MRLVFDKGTILCTLPEGRKLSSCPPCGVWDPRVSAVRVPAWRHQELITHFHGLRISIRDDSLEYGELNGEAWSEPSLRPYQEMAVEAWGLSARRGIIVLPTGSGKTRVALSAMARLCESTLCLVPTRILMHQWCKELGAYYKGLIGCLGDGIHETAPVTISTFESAYRHMSKYGNRFKMLVVDEAHHFGHGLRDEALEMSTAPYRLGLTATPSSDDVSKEKLGDLIGPVVFSVSLQDLAGRYLANFDLITLELEMTPDERKKYLRDRGIFNAVYKEFRSIATRSTWGDFCRSAHRTKAGRQALAAWRRSRRLLGYTRSKSMALGSLLKQHGNAKILVFTSDNESAYAIAREHLIMPFTCDIGRSEREDVLTRFRTGSLRALVSSRVLNEGLDVPDADVAIVVGGSFGEREHLQRIGRILRPRPGKRAVIYELITRNSKEIDQARRRSKSLCSPSR